ncbi:hypothetical protein CVT25_009347 [Psilocybe cyanescens]|uniref:Uncharacterized protein n=1 Tax=Psilocybe cyanescens TaxID=93625 RepID=A0A409XJC4_PSICY|nr:hypothetical protein CVT25_009347 [Psilocybe cyanescens]
MVISVSASVSGSAGAVPVLIPDSDPIPPPVPALGTVHGPDMLLELATPLMPTSVVSISVHDSERLEEEEVVGGGQGEETGDNGDADYDDDPRDQDVTVRTPFVLPPPVLLVLEHNVGDGEQKGVAHEQRNKEAGPARARAILCATSSSGSSFGSSVSPSSSSSRSPDRHRLSLPRQQQHALMQGTNAITVNVTITITTSGIRACGGGSVEQRSALAECPSPRHRPRSS